MRTVSVHIVTYNSAKDIIDCLDGVFKQSYPIQQVIVVDNASHDNIREVLQSYNDRVHIIYNTQNLGFAPGHNQAMHISQADYFLVLNPDVTLDREYVSKLVNSCEKKPKIGSATGRLLLKSNPHIIDSTGLVMNRARRAFDRGAGETSDLWNDSGEVFGVSGAAALYLRDMVEDISIEGQFYDESFFAYKEDVDVAWRAQKYGWRSYYCADAIAHHERGWKKGSRDQQPLFIRQYSYINRYKMIYKNDSWRNLLRNIIHILPFELASIAYALLRDPKVLRSWTSFYRELPVLRHKKKVIQNKTRSDI